MRQTDRQTYRVPALTGRDVRRIPMYSWRRRAAIMRRRRHLSSALISAPADIVVRRAAVAGPAAGPSCPGHPVADRLTCPPRSVRYILMLSFFRSFIRPSIRTSLTASDGHAVQVHGPPASLVRSTCHVLQSSHLFYSTCRRHPAHTVDRDSATI